MTDAILFVVLAVVIALVGLGLGLAVAPYLGRWDERRSRAEDEPHSRAEDERHSGPESDGTVEEEGEVDRE